MPQYKANKTLGEDLSPAVPCPKALPPSHTASRDHPGVDFVSTQAEVVKDKSDSNCVVLFLINEPVGMCHSATEFSRSCYSSRTTAPSRPGRVLVLSVHGMGWDRPEGTCCIHQEPSLQISSLAHASRVHLLWESLTVSHKSVGFISAPLLAGLSDTASHLFNSA